MRVGQAAGGARTRKCSGSQHPPHKRATPTPTHARARAHAHAHSHHLQRSRALPHPTCMLCTRLSVASSWRWKVSRISMFSAATQSANPSSSSPLALRLRRGVAGQGIKPAARHMPLTAQRRPLQSLAALHISTQQWSATSQPGPPEPQHLLPQLTPPPLPTPGAPPPMLTR